MMLLLEFLGRIIIINVINLLIQSLKIKLFCVYRKTSNFIKHGCQNSVAMVMSREKCKSEQISGEVAKFGSHRLKDFELIQLFSGRRGGEGRGGDGSQKPPGLIRELTSQLFASLHQNISGEKQNSRTIKRPFN